MSTIISVNQNGTEMKKLLVKGASEMIIDTCTHYLTSDATRCAIDEQVKEKLTTAVQEYGSLGLRTLGFAYKMIDGEKFGNLDT